MDTNETLREKNKKLKIENGEKQNILTGTPDNEKKRKKIDLIVNDHNQEINEFQTMLDGLQPTLMDALVRLAGSQFNKTNPYKIQEY